MAPKKASDPTSPKERKLMGDKSTVPRSNGTQDKDLSPSKTTNAAPKKRKVDQSHSEQHSKASRKSSRNSSAQTIDHVKVINFLLSSDAVPLCRPQDETADVQKRGEDIRTYSLSSFSPFEELVCALVLSRPIGHMLGLRSIRTLFNDPHNLNTPRAIKKAGKDGCRVALDDARTQHRQKTAEELIMIAEAVANALGKDGDDVDLQRLREDSAKDMGKEREMIRKNVKGLAKTGIDIFARRIQGVWEEWYPFADDKTLQSLEQLGVAKDAKSLVELLDQEWKQLNTAEFNGTDNEKKRQAFVRVLERAVGAGLEGNIDEVRKASA